MILGYLLLIFPAIAILSFFIYLPIFLFNKKRIGRQPFIRHLLRYCLIGVVVSIIYITIFLFGGEIAYNPNFNRLNLIPFSWLKTALQREWGYWTFALSQLILNFLMFIPFGMLLPIAIRPLSKWWKTAACTLVFTASIEVFQLFIGRSGDVDDIIMNFAGGMIGYIIFAVFRAKFKYHSWWIKATGIQK